MNITVTLEAPELVGALNNLANAFGTKHIDLTGSGIVKPLETKTPVEEETPSETASPEIAAKTLYFRHDGTGDVVLVKKGGSLDFLEGDIFDPISKEEYLERKKVLEELESSADPEPEKEETTSGITLDMITTKTREFIQADKANRVKLKEFLEEKGAPKVSELQPADYQAALDFFEAQAK